MTKILVFLVFVGILFHCAFGSTIPEFIKVCRRTDPKLGSCIKNSVEALKPALSKGIPELKIPALDPFKMAHVDALRTPNFKIVLTNLIITGLSNFEITKIKLDMEKKIYRVGVKLPAIDIQSDYDMDSIMFGAQVKSTGSIRANASGIEGKTVLNGILDDQNHLQILSIALKMTVDNFDVNLDDALNDNPSLKQTIMQFLSNANKQDLIQLGLPYLETKSTEILLETVNAILKNMDYDQLFPV